MHLHRAAVIGSPIAQSKSPVLHLLAYETLRLDGWEYTREEVDTTNLGDFIARVKTDTTWRGFSVTMPLKQAVMQYLDSVDRIAMETEAVNTVVISRAAQEEAQGHAQENHIQLKGYNTDVYGIVQAIAASEHFTPPTANVKAQSALILGTGATSRSAKAAMRELGFGDILVAGRSGEFDVPINDASALNLAARKASCIVSTLPWGAAEEILPKLNSEAIQGKPLLECAFPKVLPGSIRGEVMLAYQAIRQVKLMTGVQMRAPEQSELVKSMLTALSEV